MDTQCWLKMLVVSVLVVGCQYEMHINDSECAEACEESEDWSCYERCAAEDDDDEGGAGQGGGGGCAASSACGNNDRDGDGIPNDREHACNTHPDFPDSDGDAISDGDEDADHDGATNSDEIAAGSDPSDSRSVPGREAPDPEPVADADSDSDGLTDGAEVSYGCDPTLADTDGDGLTDGMEVAVGSDPLDATEAQPSCGAP